MLVLLFLFRTTVQLARRTQVFGVQTPCISQAPATGYIYYAINTYIHTSLVNREINLNKTSHGRKVIHDKYTINADQSNYHTIKKKSQP